MPDQIPPRPITSGGITFRSRLEYHWSVFLTIARIPWLYEPKLFRGRVWYRPDFYLPGARTWLEVKPVAPSVIQTDKAAMLAEMTDEAVYFIVGPPGRMDTRGGFPFSIVGCDHLGMKMGQCFWTRCPLCQQVGIARGGRNVMLACGCIRSQCLALGIDPERDLTRGHEAPDINWTLDLASPVITELDANEPDDEDEWDG